MDGSELFARCLCRLFAMARPMEPRPIHPNRILFAADMFKNYVSFVWETGQSETFKGVEKTK
jgi:hypothetical protein